MRIKKPIVSALCLSSVLGFSSVLAACAVPSVSSVPNGEPSAAYSASTVVTADETTANTAVKPRAPYEIEGSSITVNGSYTVLFEAENADISHFMRSSENPSDVVERSDASGGKFLAAASGSDNAIKNGYFSFDLNLNINARIVMTAVYSTTERRKGIELDLRKTYGYIIDGNKNMGLSKNYMLAKRTDITRWSTVDYDAFTLPKGEHNIMGRVVASTGNGNPNIDCFIFGITEITQAQIDAEKVPVNDFHSELQYAYLNDNVTNIHSYAQGVTELSRPNAITLDFSSDDIADAESYSVEYAETPDFVHSTVVDGLKSKSYGVYNLKLGQKLYWRGGATGAALNGSPVHELTVATRGPRNLYVDGVTNVRDIGGYSSSLAKGAVIRQGLYFRGANLESITEDGKRELLRLGVRAEIDLRDSYQCKGPYVDGIDYNAIPIPSGTESTRFEQFANEYKQIFSLIANADKKPVYLHCTAGADRTGISSFMLLAVCGASYDDIVRDYLFTNFSTHGARYLDSEFTKWWSKLDGYSGNTKAEKAKSWLISKGVTAAQVEHIREIFVEGYSAV